MPVATNTITAPMNAEDGICVLGGGGFLGSHLVEALLARTPCRVSALDVSFAKLPGRDSRLTLCEGNVGDRALLSRLLPGCRCVVSTTALCNPALYNTRPVDVIHASFSELVPLVEMCHELGLWLVHFSTCEVYGRSKGQPEGGLLVEDEGEMVLGPLSAERWTYACAKQLLERLIWAYGTHGGLPFTIVRPFNVIGPRMDYLPGIDGDGTPRVLANLSHALLSGKPLPLVNGGEARRSFLWVHDFVDAVVRIVGRPAHCQGQVINLGNPANDVSMVELARMMVEASRPVAGYERPAELKFVSAEELYGAGYDDVAFRRPDITKARRLLEWEPRTPLEAMLPETLADYAARFRTGSPGGEP